MPLHTTQTLQSIEHAHRLSLPPSGDSTVPLGGTTTSIQNETEDESKYIHK